MSVREDIEKRIEKQHQKIIDLQKQIQLEESFIQGLQEALKLIPRPDGEKQSQIGFYFRSGDTKKAYEILKKSGKPMLVDEILISIGKPVNRQNKASMASSLHRATKRTGMIKKVAANTFAVGDIPTEPGGIEPTLPDSFGDDKKTDDIPF